MTDRVRTLTVVLDHDMRTDDVESVVQAIKMVRCVDSVELGDVVRGSDHMAREVARRELRNQLWDKLRELLWDKP